MLTIAPGQDTAATGSPPPDAPPAKRLVIAASHSWRERLRLALADLADTARLWPLVWTLSLFDIRLRYRGSLLGPLWLTLSTAIMVGAIGVLYARLFHQDVADYLPFLTISLVLWNFISTVTSEATTCFTQADAMIRSMRMPHSVHAARVVMRNTLVLGHNVIVIAVVFALFGTRPGLDCFTLLPGFLLWLADAMAASLLLGLFGARFRDIPPIIASVMQIAFYVTPIMWNPAMLAHRGLAQAFVELNPFYALLEILRGPLLGLPLDPSAWHLALLYSLVLFLVTGLVFTRARPRLPYWL
ncbi:MAG: ABC transporter permease [Acidocella sp.]|nr:ABC transporter permease [Acidocella sp.]